MSTVRTTSRLTLGGDGRRSTGGRATPEPAAAGVTDDVPVRRRRHARRLADRRAGDGQGTADTFLDQQTRRVAAEVHDLVMQDLCFALASARALADDPEVAARASAVVSAAERALAGAREVLDGLAGQAGRPVVDAVEASVRAAGREIPLSFDASRVPPDAEPGTPTLCALLHIGREAVTNAVKHGDPSEIGVVLEYGDQWRLKVGDRGSGFDLCEPSSGFGLSSMSSHSEALGGVLRVTSVPEQGTIVEAVLP
jgi:signal transduction histidine kinase